MWQGAYTVAPGIRVPVAVGDFLILQAVRESGGWCAAIEDSETLTAVNEFGARTGMLLCPEGGACFAAYKAALADGRIKASDRVVLFNCASGVKYPLQLPPPRPVVLKTEDIPAVLDEVRRGCARDQSERRAATLEAAKAHAARWGAASTAVGAMVTNLRRKLAAANDAGLSALATVTVATAVAAAVASAVTAAILLSRAGRGSRA